MLSKAPAVATANGQSKSPSVDDVVRLVSRLSPKQQSRLVRDLSREVPLPRRQESSAPVTADDVRDILTRVLREGRSLSSVCIEVFGNRDRHRRQQILQWAEEFGFLDLAFVNDLAHRLEEKSGLRRIRVVDVDTTTAEGQTKYGHLSARFFFDCVRQLHCAATGGKVYVGLGGGEAASNMVSGLPNALLSATWLPYMRDSIHLRTLTAGHQREQYSPYVNLACCGQALGIELSGPEDSPTGHSLSSMKRAWLPPESFGNQNAVASYKKKHAILIQHLQTLVNLSFTGCAGEGEFCPAAIQSSNPQVRLPTDWRGEVLFSFFDTEGISLPHGGFVVTAFPDDSLPERIRDKSQKKRFDPFFSVGSIFESRDAGVVPKARALSGAILGEKKWFTHLICTKAIAEAALETIQRS